MKLIFHQENPFRLSSTAPGVHPWRRHPIPSQEDLLRIFRGNSKVLSIGRLCHRHRLPPEEEIYDDDVSKAYIDAFCYGCTADGGDGFQPAGGRCDGARSRGVNANSDAERARGKSTCLLEMSYLSRCASLTFLCAVHTPVYLSTCLLEMSYLSRCASLTFLCAVHTPVYLSTCLPVY